MSSVSVIVVSWNVRGLLRECLRTLWQAPWPDEVVVVDNDSADGSAEMVAAEFPDARVVRSGANVGFSAGVNVGLRSVSGDHLLVLNPDTEMRPCAVTAMSHLLDVDASAALIAPQLIDPCGGRQSTRRRFPTWMTLAVESTELQDVPLLRTLPRRYRCADTSDAHVQEIGWPFGACFMVRRAALAEIGGMDETYFMYSEEVDLCRRLWQLGWRVLYEPAAVVVHHMGKSSEQAPMARRVRFNRSKVLYATKNLGPSAGEMLRVRLLGSLAWGYGVEAAKLLAGHKPALRRMRMGEYRSAIATGLRRLP